MTARVREGLRVALGAALIVAAIVWLSGGCSEKVGPGELELPASGAGGALATVAKEDAVAIEWASDYVAVLGGFSLPIAVPKFELDPWIVALGISVSPF